jgi:hypothetical protein
VIAGADGLGFVRPVLEEPPLATRSPGGAVEKPGFASAEPLEGPQVMRSGEDVDAVDLVQAQPRHQTVQMTSIDAPGTRRSEPLRGQLDPACLSGADPFRHRQSPVSWSPVKKSLRRSNREGDAINAILCAAGHNLRLLAAWLAILTAFLIAAIRDHRLGQRSSEAVAFAN